MPCVCIGTRYVDVALEIGAVSRSDSFWVYRV